MTTATPPRRNWHLQRWLVLAAGFLAYAGWTQYAFRAALKEARALGWEVDYTAPVEEIRKNWKAAFKKATWMDGVRDVHIPTCEAFEQHLAIVHRLNPKGLRIEFATILRDLSPLKNLPALQTVELEFCLRLTNVDGLKNLSALKTVELEGCTGLTNVDALKNLSALNQLWLEDCTGLTNVDGLKNLSALSRVWLDGCTGLAKESVAALEAALPKAYISGP